MAHKNKKVLIIRFSSLGDIILTLPVVNKLYKEGFEVHFLTKKVFADVWENYKPVKKLLLLDDKTSLREIIRQIKKENYFKIIDLHSNLRSWIIKLFFFKKTITYKKYKFRRWLLVNFKINLLKGNNVIRNYLETVEKLGLKVKPEDEKYKIHCDKTAKRKIDEFLKKHQLKEYICIAPLAKWKTKIWPYYRRIIPEIAKKIPVVLIGGFHDYSSLNKFVKPGIKNVYNTAGLFSPFETAELIRKSRLLITNDSAVMHLGYSTNTPMIIILGNTVKEFGFIPEGKNIYIIERNDVRCRPCDYHGKEKCPLIHFKCMKKIKPEEVITRVDKILKIK